MKHCEKCWYSWCDNLPCGNRKISGIFQTEEEEQEQELEAVGSVTPLPVRSNRSDRRSGSGREMAAATGTLRQTKARDDLHMLQLSGCSPDQARSFNWRAIAELGARTNQDAGTLRRRPTDKQCSPRHREDFSAQRFPWGGGGEGGRRRSIAYFLHHLDAAPPSLLSILFLFSRPVFDVKKLSNNLYTCNKPFSYSLNLCLIVRSRICKEVCFKCSWILGVLDLPGTERVTYSLL